MSGYKGFKQAPLLIGRKLKIKYPAIGLLFILSFYFTWSATSRLEEQDKMVKKGPVLRKTLDLPSFVTKARRHPVNSSYDLMIFSYMRSGSTMTGEVFAENKDFFFVFEPLLSILPYQYFTTTDICKMRNLECSSKDFNTKVSDAMNLLSNIYDCNLRAIHPPTLEYIVKENKSGSSWSEFSECANKAMEGRNLTIKSVVNSTETVHLFDKCFVKLEGACQNSRAKVTKVLRLSMRLILKLLSELPSLKILLLVRDPRAIINSRLITDWFPICEKDWFGVFENTRSLCKKMQDDIYVIYRLKQEFPDRLLIHRLEDVVTDSPKMFSGIFDFMNLRGMEVEMQRIRTKYINQNYEGFIGKWKKMLKDQFVNMVNENCETVLSYYEYAK